MTEEEEEEQEQEEQEHENKRIRPREGALGQKTDYNNNTNLCSLKLRLSGKRMACLKNQLPKTGKLKFPTNGKKKY